MAHGAEQHARSLMFAGGGGSAHTSEEPAAPEAAAPPAEEVPPADEPPPAAHHASHTIFKMPDGFSKDFMMWSLVVLVIAEREEERLPCDAASCSPLVHIHENRHQLPMRE